MKQRASQGFTLIELMIVVAIIAIVAGVAVPNLLSSRAIANERAVVSALRTIVTAQVQCQTRALVDMDGDGQGEALGLGEMAGLRDLRNGTVPLAPPTLPTSLGSLDAAGRCMGRGYLIALHLPDAAGAGLATIPGNDGSISPDAAEVAWTCIAWPVTRGRTGRATYFVNQAGEILVAKDATYDGTTSVPPPGSGLAGVAPTVIVGGVIAADTIGADGNLWTLVR